MRFSSNWIDILPWIVGVVLVGVGVRSFGWVNILKETNKLLKEQNTELKNQNNQLRSDNKTLTEKYTDSERAIAKLEGKIDNLTVIPLARIDQSLADMARDNKSSADSNAQVVQILSKSALIAAEDKEALLGPQRDITVQHVDTQIVDHKTS